MQGTFSKLWLTLGAGLFLLSSVPEARPLFVGAEAGFSGSPDFGITLRHENSLAASLTFDFDPAGLGIGAWADWWFLHFDFNDLAGAYLGIGLYGYGIAGNFPGVRAGFRLPVAGFQFFPAGKYLEIFIEAAPAIGFISPGGPGLGLGYQTGAGFRFSL